MRKHGLTLLILCLFATIIFAQPEDQKPTTETYFKLDNGLKVFLRQRSHTPLVNVVFAIGVGSRDDSKSAGGLVHLLEHLMLLGSTQNFSNQELVTTIRQHGIFFNAHTDHDLMTLELSAPAENLETILSLAIEKLFQFKPTESELAKEKKIILEEMNQIMDDPERMGTSLVIQHLFANHPYSHPILGQEESIKKTAIDNIETFRKKYFIANNISLAIVGKIDIPQVKGLIEKLLEGIPKGEKPDREIPVSTKIPKKVVLKQQMDVQQCHLFFGFLAPHFDHQDRLGMNVVIQILGHGVNPMLRSALRGGRRKLAERVSIRYIALKYAGAILIHLKVKPKIINSARRETIKFLHRVRSARFSKNEYPSSQQRFAIDYLDNARNHLNLLYQSLQEYGLTLATSYARSMLMQGQSHKESYLDRLQKIKSKNLGKVIHNYLNTSKFVQLTINPQDKK